jgi:phosphoglucosamine mutase
LKTLFPRYKDFSTIDGVRLTLEEGWVLIRASGTEPLMRLTVEGESLRVAKQIMRESVRLVRRAIKEKL